MDACREFEKSLKERSTEKSETPKEEHNVEEIPDWPQLEKFKGKESYSRICFNLERKVGKVRVELCGFIEDRPF